MRWTVCLRTIFLSGCHGLSLLERPSAEAPPSIMPRTRCCGTCMTDQCYDRIDEQGPLRLARIIHEGPSRKRADAKRDGHSEAGDRLCRLRQCLSRSSDGGRHQEEGCQPPPVCRRAERRDCPSQPRIHACSRSFVNNAGKEPDAGRHGARRAARWWKSVLRVWLPTYQPTLTQRIRCRCT
jgi:hypothetical protein